MLASSGEIGEPCGVPVSTSETIPPSKIPARSQQQAVRRIDRNPSEDVAPLDLLAPSHSSHSQVALVGTVDAKVNSMVHLLLVAGRNLAGFGAKPRLAELPNQRGVDDPRLLGQFTKDCGLRAFHGADASPGDLGPCLESPDECGIGLSNNQDLRGGVVEHEQASRRVCDVRDRPLVARGRPTGHLQILPGLQEVSRMKSRYGHPSASQTTCRGTIKGVPNRRLRGVDGRRPQRRRGSIIHLIWRGLPV